MIITSAKGEASNMFMECTVANTSKQEGKSENKVPYFITSHSEMPFCSLITHFTSLFFHIVTFSVDFKESEESTVFSDR
jgi:hypothetical protein